MWANNRNRGTRVRHIFGSVVAALTVAACSLATDRDLEIRPVPVRDFRVLSHSDLSFSFEVTGEWPNTCGSFAQFETNRTGNTFTVEIFGRAPVGAICGDAITPITGVWTSSVPTAGVYTFQFSRQSLAPLDTTITFTT